MQNKIIAMMLGLLGAAAICGGLYMFVNPDYSLTSEQTAWAKTIGSVTETTQAQSGEGYDFSAQYVVAGDTYHLKGSCGFPLKTVTVRYDPQAPDRSVYTLGQAASIPLLLAFVGGGVAMLVTAYFKLKASPANQH